MSKLVLAWVFNLLSMVFSLYSSYHFFFIHSHIPFSIALFIFLVQFISVIVQLDILIKGFKAERRLNGACFYDQERMYDSDFFIDDEEDFFEIEEDDSLPF